MKHYCDPIHKIFYNDPEMILEQHSYPVLGHNRTYYFPADKAFQGDMSNCVAIFRVKPKKSFADQVISKALAA